MQGNVNAGHNSFIYDSNTKILMEERDSGLYQVLYINGSPTETHRFDISFGIRDAQTYLYWLVEHAYDLPVSYYTAVNEWATSPGFSAATPDFKRMNGRDCFECHSSYITNIKNTAATGDYFSVTRETERLEKKSLVYGIDCQRCHGPAAGHVNYHFQYPEIKTAKYIVTNRSLNRQHQLDQCAVCHSGNDKRKLRSRFIFKPGDLLADFFLPSAAPDSNRNFDVHGNQFNLLKQSQCFLTSKTMNCSTCHNPHNNLKETIAIYSQKCMNCHSEAGVNFCKAIPAPGIFLKDNCIDCHMPKQSSGAISFQLAGSAAVSSYLLRTHRIAVYNTKEK